MSLRDLAARSGVSATMLSQVEREVTEPSLSTLRRLAEVFGESVASLFDSSPPAVRISRPGTRSTLAGPRGLVRYERLTPGNVRLQPAPPLPVRPSSIWSRSRPRLPSGATAVR